MPDRPKSPNGPAAHRANVEAVQKIINDAEKVTMENIRLASLAESYRRSIFLLIQKAGGEVVLDKAIAMLVNGQAGISKRFRVIADDPTQPDALIYRIEAPPESLEDAMQIGQTPQEAAEARHAGEQLAPTITWAAWELEAVLANGARWRTWCHGDHGAAEVIAAFPEGTRLVAMRLSGKTGEPPPFEEAIVFNPPPDFGPSEIVAG